MPELTWEGKYDKEGRRAAPLRVALPFQTVETVNESTQERQRALDLFGSGRDPEWRNRLIWGDKKYVLPALLEDFAGKVDLIYIDPPFATGQDFSLPITVDGEGFDKSPSMIEVKAYRDTWGQGLDSYLHWFAEMAMVFGELLSETGSLYVHLDPGMSHYVKVILDDVLGIDNFRNEITWRRTGAHGRATRWGPIHDSLLFYTKSTKYIWNRVLEEYDESYVEDFYRFSDEHGRYRLVTLDGPGTRKGPSGQPWRGIDPTKAGRHWEVPPDRALPPRFEHPPGYPQMSVQERLDVLDSAGLIYWPTKGKKPQHKRYLDAAAGNPLQDIISDIRPVSSMASERLGYPTQKPVQLLERIISASSNEDALVLDCVCGSGTTVVAAERLKRRWIAADLSRFAVHTTRKRLLSEPGVRPFVVQNLGKYERQLWQSAEFGDQAEARMLTYRRFILDLYNANNLEGYIWLHGQKAGRLVHVATVDAPVTVGDLRQIAIEFKKVVGTGKKAPKLKSVDVLGWDFAFEVNEVAKQEAALGGIDMRFVRIPREVLDKRAVEQGDVRFFELAALAIDLERKGKRVTLTITDFVIPVDDVPDEVRTAIKSWTQWIDYWAVDWDNAGDSFHNEWQAYRTRQSPKLDFSVTHTYDKPGSYTIVVKVIDILGNDTTKTLKVEVK